MKSILPCLAALPLVCAMAATAADARAPKPVRKAPRKPIICAHRGASAQAPENTVAAFQLAGRLGADMFELDTTVTKDGVPVVMHDASVSRTTNGEGNVADLELADILKLDAGSFKGPRYAGEPVPLLETALVKRDGLTVLIEIKGGDASTRATVEKVVPLVQRLGLQKEVVIQSFNAGVVARAHELDPTIPTALLFSQVPESLPPGITWVNAAHPTVTAEFMQWARDKGYHVGAWTVNKPEDMRRLMDLGVDMIITDVPDILRKLRDGA